MKRSHACTKCDSTQLLHLTQVADRVGEFGEPIETKNAAGPLRDHHKAWRIARVPIPKAEHSMWRINVATAGMVEAFVCRGCGYTEFYTIDPENIPVDGEFVKELSKPAIGPFR